MGVARQRSGRTRLRYFASDLARERDVEQAKSLLAQAGQKHLTVKLDTSDVVPGAVDCATVYVQNAADAGVTVRVNNISPSV